MTFEDRIKAAAYALAPAIAFLIASSEWGMAQIARFDRWLASWSQQPTWDQPVFIDSIAPVDPKRFTTKDLRELLILKGLQPPSRARKHQLLALALS